MTQEDIIRMAREANNGKVRVWEECHLLYPDELLRFAALVAAAENEACAKVCEEVAVDSYTKIGMAHAPYMKATAEDCASHIRARGQA